MPELKEIKDGSSYTRRDVGETRTRIARSLGWHVEGLAPLAPDPNDPTLTEYGAKYRFMRKLPPVEKDVRERFREFVRVYVRAHLKPLDPSSDTSFEGWLANTDYPEWRKDELRKAKIKAKTSNMYKNKSFVKREFYREFKHARWINARTDKFKAETGPIFKLIEQEVFKKKCFIKKIPVEQRSEYIRQRLMQVGATYVGTDFSAFEAMFDIDTVNTIEMQLYLYMTQNLPEYRQFIEYCIAGIAAGQKCYKSYKSHKHVAKTEARMSGDMCTSLGNGFSNLMIMKFVCSELGWSDVKGVVEGDDGLFRVAGKMPTPEDFAKVGAFMKMEVHSNVNEAGFCHLFSTDDRAENLIDPMNAIIRSGWTMSELKDAKLVKLHTLSKAKALSLLCEAPANPITAAMARWIIRVLPGVKGEFNWKDPKRFRDKQIMMSANLKKCFDRSILGPTQSQREFVARKWGVSIDDQIQLENYFDSLNTIQPIDHPAIYRNVHSSDHTWSWHNCVEHIRAGVSWFYSPL